MYLQSESAAVRVMREPIPYLHLTYLDALIISTIRCSKLLSSHRHDFSRTSSIDSSHWAHAMLIPLNYFRSWASPLACNLTITSGYRHSRQIKINPRTAGGDTSNARVVHRLRRARFSANPSSFGVHKIRLLFSDFGPRHIGVFSQSLVFAVASLLSFNVGQLSRYVHYCS